VRGQDQRALAWLEQAAAPQRLRELQDAQAQPEVRPERLPAVALRAASAVLRASAPDA